LFLNFTQNYTGHVIVIVLSVLVKQQTYLCSKFIYRDNSHSFSLSWEEQISEARKEKANATLNNARCCLRVMS